VCVEFDPNVKPSGKRGRNWRKKINSSGRGDLLKQNKTNKATRYLTGKRKILAIKRSRRSCPPANPLEKNKKKMTAGEINEKEQKQINEMINLK
jgi:hypothetical protein